MSRFRNIFDRFYKRSQTEVLPIEILTRFLAQNSYFTESTNRIRPSAFIPANDELSVFRTSNYDEHGIWKLALDYVDDRARNRLMKGRAELFAQVVLTQGLRITSDARPHRAHANVVDWPQEKHARKDIAIELAKESILFVRR